MNKFWMFLVLPILHIAFGIGFLKLLQHFGYGRESSGTYELVFVGLALIVSLVDAWLIQRAKEFKAALVALWFALLISIVVVVVPVVLGLVYLFVDASRSDDASAGAGPSFAIIFAFVILLYLAVIRVTWFACSVLVARIAHPKTRHSKENTLIE
jgi:hypothetical protein